MMKYLKLTTFSVAFLFCVQSMAQSNVGGLLAYASDIKNLGIGINGEHFINGKLSIAPSFIYFFSKTQFSVKQNMWELNGDANYQFYTTGNVRVFFIGGLNITGIKVKFSDPSLGSFSNTTTRVGLNIGSGVNFDISMKWQPFFMLKYVISDFDHFVIGGGVKYKIK